MQRGSVRAASTCPTSTSAAREQIGLFAGRRIVAVDGEPTLSLDAFVDVVKRHAGQEAVRLNTVSFNDVPEVITMKLDPEYWPSYELRREGYEWKRHELK